MKSLRKVVRCRSLMLLSLAVALGLTGLVLSPKALAQATTTRENFRIPQPPGFTVFIPCALGGLGEVVSFSTSGYLHVHTELTFDPAGGFHLKIHTNAQNANAIGLVSGDMYRGTGSFDDMIESSSSLPFEATHIANFRIIGQATGNNLLIHATLHTTINANGDVVMELEKMSVDCK